MALPVSRVKTPVSPKVVLASVGALLLPILLTGLASLVGYVIGHPDVLADVPEWLRVPVLAMLAAIGALVAGYRQRDPIREVGATELAGQGVLPTVPETGPGGASGV
jgi:hypothetical protein